MQQRTGFRQRPIDATKQIQIVKNLKKVMESTDLESKKELNSIETELNKILELYDKKKIIIIPNVEKIDNRNNESNKEKLKKSNSKNSSLEKKELLMKNKSDIEYIQKEFKRPNHYIIYSEKQRQENLKRDYEATINDINFINFEKGFMKLEELEKVISTLENDIGDGEQIPSERVKNIIIDLYPKYENYVEKITKYFFTRRELFKKSLCRKFWKEQKTTDKYITTTFRRREREKMKMRKNKQNELESLDKIKEIKNLSNTFIATILNSINLREDLKKALIKINEFNFESKICILKNEKITKDLEDEWKQNEKKLNEIKKQLEEKEKKDEENLIINTRENSPKINNEYSNSQKNTMINSINKDNLRKINNKDKNKENNIKPKPNNNYIRKFGDSSILKRSLELPEPENSDDEENYLKLRFRLNRNNMFVVDRYIQKKNSFNPFDDSINKDILKFKKYDEDLIQVMENEKNFDSLYDKYLKNCINPYYLFSDSEDDSSNFQNQLKNFQYSHKQFLKQKRGHN